jgi:hypothetical protein
MSGKRALSTPAQADEWRKKIQVSQLVNRLRDHATGKVEMSATQVQAARILLAKTIPDMKAIEHSGEVEHKVNATIYAPSKAPLPDA